MVDSYRLSNALAALGGGLETFGKMQLTDQERKDRMALEMRKEAADRQFRATLQQNMLDAENQRQQNQLAETAKDRELSRELSRENKESQLQMEQRRLDSENQFRSAQLGIEGSRLGLERERLGQSRENATQMRAAAVIQTRVAGIERSMQAYNAQANKEKEDLQKSNDYLLMDDGQKQQAMSRIDSKYAPLIQGQQKLRDKYNARLGELTGVNFDDEEGSSGSAPATDTSAGDMNTDGGMPSPPPGIGASPATPGQMPPKPPGLSGAPATQAPATPQAPYPEGARLIGRDGKQYVVKDGKPTPAGQ